MLAVIHHAHDHLARLASSEDVDTDALLASPALAELGRMKYWDPESTEQSARQLMRRITEEVGGA